MPKHADGPKNSQGWYFNPIAYRMREQYLREEQEAYEERCRARFLRSPEGQQYLREERERKRAEEDEAKAKAFQDRRLEALRKAVATGYFKVEPQRPRVETQRQTDRERDSTRPR